MSMNYKRLVEMDEDAGIEALIMRPGLFLLEIPNEILVRWKAVQDIQRKSKLNAIIQNKIDKKKDLPGLPPTNRLT